MEANNNMGLQNSSHYIQIFNTLPIPYRKASIDDRIEYALQLIEQGKIILPNDPNDNR